MPPDPAIDAAVIDAVVIGGGPDGATPLSSFGVRKAMVSAWFGAVVANTCLRNPKDALREALKELKSGWVT